MNLLFDGISNSSMILRILNASGLGGVGKLRWSKFGSHFCVHQSGIASSAQQIESRLREVDPARNKKKQQFSGVISGFGATTVAQNVNIALDNCWPWYHIQCLTRLRALSVYLDHYWALNEANVYR